MSRTAERLLTKSFSSSSYICRTCLQKRSFSNSPKLLSGHNKWSTIKHDKAKNDKAKNNQRSGASHEIALASKFYGPDPNANPRLALAIQVAKRAGVPKALIEAAINRGQGISATGAALENVTLEAVFPPGIATVIDCQTDNKLRTLAELRLLVKVHKGSVSPIGYLFNRRGRVTLGTREDLNEEQVLEAALEAGALDVQEGGDNPVIYTEVNDTKAVAQSVSESLGISIEEAEIFYDPNEETMVTVDSADDVGNLIQFVEKIQDQVSGFQAIYHNGKPGDEVGEVWAGLQNRIEG